MVLNLIMLYCITNDKMEVKFENSTLYCFCGIQTLQGFFLFLKLSILLWGEGIFVGKLKWHNGLFLYTCISERRELFKKGEV